jgi:hypothetical protein
VLPVLLAALAAAGTTVVRSEVFGSTVVTGVGCGVAATKDVPLPAANATGVVVKRPKVGATTDESQITAVDVLGTTIRVTAVGAGPPICDPEADEETPPEQRPWEGAYDMDVSYRERVSVGSWSGRLRDKVRQRPSRVLIPEQSRAVGVRWQRFGGRKAVGSGTLRNISPVPGRRCTPKSCVGEGDRVKIVLSRPSRCVDTGQTVYYGRIRFYATRTYPLLYPVRKGAVLTGGSPACSRAPQPV